MVSLVGKMDKRYLKNCESVTKICKDLGYKLTGFDPDWSVSGIRAEVPDEDNVVWKSDMLGNCITIPDEFMATIALLMGYDWQFGYQDTDVDFKDSIESLETLKKNISLPTDIEVIAKSSGMCKDVLDKIEESRKKDLEDCQKRLKNLMFILGTRQKLRAWKKNS